MPKLKDVLEGMGVLGEEIAAFLKEKKIRGSRQHANSCPVANYLKSLGYTGVYASEEQVEVSNESIYPPDGIADFIHEFDRGEYPDLDSDERGFPDAG